MHGGITANQPPDKVQNRLQINFHSFLLLFITLEGFKGSIMRHPLINPLIIRGNVELASADWQNTHTK